LRFAGESRHFRLSIGRLWLTRGAGAALVRKKIGMRYVMRVVPIDPSPVARHPRPAAADGAAAWAAALA
jgi:hypothetical protein